MNENPRRIDTHHHILPDFFAKAIKESGSDPKGLLTRKWSLKQAKEHMAMLGIETAILSISTPSTTIYEGNKEKGRTFARELNEYSADLVKNNPKQFGFFASLPSLTDVEGVLNEIDYVHSTLHPDGYTLFTSYGNGQYLGHPSFQPIWAKLNQLKAVVFIHPTTAATNIVNRYLIPSIIDFPHETTRTAADLVLTGTCAVYTDVKIILSHAGGTLPYLARRIAMVSEKPDLQCPRQSDEILADFRSFYYDTALSSSAAQLQALLEFADPSKILFGSDAPYPPLSTILDITKSLDKFFINNKLDERKELLQAINCENAKSLFPDKFKD